MGIGDIIIFLAALVTFCYIYFFYSVYKFFSTLIFWQIRIAVVPYILVCIPPGRCCTLFFFLRSIFYLTVKFQRDTSRTLSILVFLIIPDLGSTYAGRLRCITVCDCSSVIAYTISLRHYFFHRINDFFATFIYRKVRILIFPYVSTCIRPDRFVFHFCTGFVYIFDKLQDYCLRTFSITVSTIFPGFGSFKFCCLRGMGIDNVVSFLALCIAFWYNSFLNCIRYHLSTFVFRQIGVTILPYIFVCICPGRCCICYFCLLSTFYLFIKFQCNTSRAFSILVTSIIPGLGSAYFNLSLLSVRNLYRTICHSTLLVRTHYKFF